MVWTQHSARTDNVGRPSDTEECLFPQRLAETDLLLAFVNREPCSKNHGNGMAGQALCNPARNFFDGHAPGRD